MSFPGVFEEMDVPKKVWDDVRWLGEPLGSLTNFFFQNWLSESTFKNMANVESFWATGPPKLTFVESKKCQFLFTLSKGQDGVFQKILTSPIS